MVVVLVLLVLVFTLALTLSPSDLPIQTQRRYNTCVIARIVQSLSSSSSSSSPSSPPSLRRTSPPRLSMIAPIVPSLSLLFPSSPSHLSIETQRRRDACVIACAVPALCLVFVRVTCKLICLGGGTFLVRVWHRLESVVNVQLSINMYGTLASTNIHFLLCATLGSLGGTDEGCQWMATGVLHNIVIFLLCISLVPHVHAIYDENPCCHAPQLPTKWRLTKSSYCHASQLLTSNRKFSWPCHASQGLSNQLCWYSSTDREATRC